MEPLLYVIMGALCVTAATIVYFQFSMKRYQRDLGKMGGVRNEDVVSLDEEEIEAKQFRPPPSKVYMFGCMAITCMMIVWYIVFGGTGGGGDENNLTYDELGYKALCEQVMTNNSGSRKDVKVLLILPQEIYLNYIDRDPKKPHPIVDELVKNTVEKGRKYLVTAVEPSVSVTRKIVEPRDNDLTPSNLRDIMRKHEDVELVIALVGFHKSCGEEVPANRDRSFFLAVFCSEARLNEYLDLAHVRAFDLAVLSNGFYNRNTVIPDKPSQEELVKRHFTFISPQNEPGIRGSMRQTITKSADIP